MTIRGTLLVTGTLLWIVATVCWLRAYGSWRVFREGWLFFLLGLPFLVAGAFFSSSSYPGEVVPGLAAAGPPVVVMTTPRPPPAPPATPLPAPKTYAEAVVAAQRDAVARYPELGQSGTPLNARFVAAYRRLRLEDPSYFSNPGWPVVLADELARQPAVGP